MGGGRRGHWLADLPDGFEAGAHGVAQRIEPAPAAARVAPLFVMQALGVLAHEDIVAPLRVGHGVGGGGPDNAAFATAGEFDLGAGAAPGTNDLQHGCFLSVRRRLRRARLSGGRYRSDPVTALP